MSCFTPLTISRANSRPGFESNLFESNQLTLRMFGIDSAMFRRLKGLYKECNNSTHNSRGLQRDWFYSTHDSNKIILFWVNSWFSSELNTCDKLVTDLYSVDLFKAKAIFLADWSIRTMFYSTQISSKFPVNWADSSPDNRTSPSIWFGSTRVLIGFWKFWFESTFDSSKKPFESTQLMN